MTASRGIFLFFIVAIVFCLLSMKVANADQTIDRCGKENSGNSKSCSGHTRQEQNGRGVDSPLDDDNESDDTYKIVNNVKISDPFVASTSNPNSPSPSPSSPSAASNSEFAVPEENFVILGH